MPRRLIYGLVLLFVLPAAQAMANEDPGASFRSYCSADAPTTLFLVDRTTAYDATDSGDLDDGLYSTIMGLDAGDRIAIRTIGNDPFASERVFEGCRPGCVYKSVISHLNCSEIGERPKVNAFYHGAADSLKSLREESEEHAGSRIFATIDALTDEYRDDHLKSLVIFSDLLEHSSDVSTAAVLHEPAETVLKRLKSLGLSARLSGVDVLVFGVGRSDAPGRHGLSMSEFQNLKDVWTQWFEQGGAASVEIYQWYPKSQ